ncbi:MAG: hypothetical protein ACI8PZ_007493 [Myxococcota bacterium]|jgi:hypothetical protein
MPTRLPATWPTAPVGRDPFDEPPAVDLAARHRDHLSSGGELDATAYASTVVQFEEARSDVLAGRAPSATLLPLMEQLAIHTPARHARGAPWAPMEAAAEADLVRIAADFSPAVGNDAPDLVLGPWADVMDIRRPPHRRALTAAIALYAVSEVERPLRAATERWRVRRPRFPPEERERVLHVQQAPQGVWHVEAGGPTGYRLRDLVGLHPRFVPSEPVTLGSVGAVGSQPLVGSTLTARVLPTPAGWVGVTALQVDGQVPPAAVAAWVRLLTARSRLVGRRDPVEGILARRGHVLARRLHEWAWSQA